MSETGTSTQNLGTGAGTTTETTTGVMPPDVLEVVWDLRAHNGGQGLPLRGVAQGLALNLGAASPGTGNKFSGSITFTEEPTTA